MLAFLRREPGHETVAGLMPGSLLSAVNFAEVVTKLVERGSSGRGRRERRGGVLWTHTRPLGLSLGDRACLALALREKLPAVTADRRWTERDLGLEIRLLRPAEA
ncbi:MAG TPA: hypothetical protein VM434_08485 [Beijerinckiaceae bacterium]|nr:hypothetical protein [Beijerinckiaceae bacterium]